MASMAQSRRLVFATCLQLLLCWQSLAYYLPGTYPQEFFMGQTIQGDGPSQAPAKAVCFDQRRLLCNNRKLQRHIWSSQQD